MKWVLLPWYSKLKCGINPKLAQLKNASFVILMFTNTQFYSFSCRRASRIKNKYLHLGEAKLEYGVQDWPNKVHVIHFLDVCLREWHQMSLLEGEREERGTEFCSFSIIKCYVGEREKRGALSFVPSLPSDIVAEGKERRAENRKQILFQHFWMMYKKINAML